MKYDPTQEEQAKDLKKSVLSPPELIKNLMRKAGVLEKKLNLQKDGILMQEHAIKETKKFLCALKHSLASLESSVAALDAAAKASERHAASVSGYVTLLGAVAAAVVLATATACCCACCCRGKRA